MRANCSAKHAAVFVGFDSAWAGNNKVPGAICSIAFDGAEFTAFQAPHLVCFERASAFIEAAELSDRPLLVAIDQPTLVPNDTGMRPVEKVAASLISWLGGGVQPANRNKKMFFGLDAPVWTFLNRLGAVQAPELSREAVSGRHLIEVFPALALPSLDERFFGRGNGPRYNPGRRKTFNETDWAAVIDVTRDEARRFKCAELVRWLDGLPSITPRKADQDMLDAAICLLIAMRWRLAPRHCSTMLGDVVSGYIVAPVSTGVRAYLAKAARERKLPMDERGRHPGGSFEGSVDGYVTFDAFRKHIGRSWRLRS